MIENLNSSEFNNLLHDVIENPEILLDSNKISYEQLLEIQKKINPYLGLIEDSDPNNKQIAVCSYTNLREDYIRRFTMTSFTSFIFQMLHEYEVPKEQLSIKSNKLEPHSDQVFDINYLKNELDSILRLVNSIEDIEKNILSKTKKELVKTSYFNNDSIENNAINILTERKTGILLTVTSMIKELGNIANSKLDITINECNKYPDLKSIIESKPIKYSSNTEIAELDVKNIIYSFLKNYLSFDPSIHIRSGIDSDKIRKETIIVNNQEVVVDIDDPSHLTTEAIKTKITANDDDKNHLNLLLNNLKTYNAALHIIRDPNLYEPITHMINNCETFKHYLLPLQKLNLEHIAPQDTFHRWSYFTEVNYEELRTITETIYPDKPDLDWALAIWATFKGTEEEVSESFTNYCQKHQDDLPSVMKSIEVGKWALLADFKENRKNIQFYNKNTDVLKKIIDRHTEDKKIGTELMRHRVKTTKAKNIRESGPDAPGLKTYKATMSTDGKDLLSKGVEQVISPEDMKRLEKAKGNIKAAKELEVLDEYEKIIKEYDEIKKNRDLSYDELKTYNKAEDIVKQAKEMLNVPDDAIQVDVFTTSSDGKFGKSHFYTKCDEAFDNETVISSNKSSSSNN
jgi:hypothetical protein